VGLGRGGKKHTGHVGNGCVMLTIHPTVPAPLVLDRESDGDAGRTCQHAPHLPPSKTKAITMCGLLIRFG
jgi:hypothetical protein